MVSMLYIKSVNTINHNTTFASIRLILLISNNSNWIGALGAKTLYGVGRTQREALVYRGHILYFSEFHPKDKIHLCFKINKQKSQHLPFAPLPWYNTPCLPLNLCLSFGFYSFWVVFHWSQEKLQKMLIQNFGGQTRCIIYRRCENGRLV